MKNLIKAVLSLALLVSIAQLNAYTASTSTTQVGAVANMAQPIAFDQDTFIAPIDGSYTISYDANLSNALSQQGTGTIQAFINNQAAPAVILTSVVPSKGSLPATLSRTLDLKAGDVVQFKFTPSHTGISLQPGFSITIEPA